MDFTPVNTTTPKKGAAKKVGTGATPTKDPTASEAMFFFSIVKHTKNKADIDWVAVAEDQGFKNAEVAKVRTPPPLIISPPRLIAFLTLFALRHRQEAS